MIARAALSALHLLALALGFASVFTRGRRLRDLRRAPEDGDALRRLLLADSFWGVAALLWTSTGLLRVFGRLEKTPDFYLRNGFFWVKMGLFALVLVLEIFPMLTFIRWRLARARGQNPAAGADLSLLITLNDAEVAIVVLIPFAAALMARGAWLF
jgi:putative membrane protein